MESQRILVYLRGHEVVNERSVEITFRRGWNRREIDITTLSLTVAKQAIVQKEISVDGPYLKDLLRSYPVPQQK